MRDFRLVSGFTCSEIVDVTVGMYREWPCTHIPVSHMHFCFMSGLAPHDKDGPQLVSVNQPSEWTGIGTDTSATHGHPASEVQELWGWHPSCDPAPLTTSFGAVGQWERRRRATAPQHGRQPQFPSGISSLPVLHLNAIAGLRVVVVRVLFPRSVAAVSGTLALSAITSTFWTVVLCFFECGS